MNDTFLIEIEVIENAKYSIFEKLREEFLVSGFVILRETNSEIEFYRPLPVNREQLIGYLKVDKVHIVAGETSIKVVCSLSKIKRVMFTTILLAPILQILLAVLSYFMKGDLVEVKLLVLGSFLTPIAIYFMFRYIYQQTFRLYADKIQRIVR
ncbi:MAG: hypothetical protein N3G21_10685 [Candidatus Hydrogenedentes bacterium]|nr:hypothetical protein [Candidatus Hydrogenedentota bacterium]